MTKVIEVRKQGYVWHIDLDFVANHRADHYSDDEDTTRQEEIDFVMNDGYEGIDWFQNNMNWSDVPDEKKSLISSPPIPKEPDDITEECDISIEIIES